MERASEEPQSSHGWCVWIASLNAQGPCQLVDEVLVEVSQEFHLDTLLTKEVILAYVVGAPQPIKAPLRKRSGHNVERAERLRLGGDLGRFYKLNRWGQGLKLDAIGVGGAPRREVV